MNNRQDILNKIKRILKNTNCNLKETGNIVANLKLIECSTFIVFFIFFLFE